MNRKNKCKLLAWTMTAALTITASPSSGMTASAKKGSQVYYTTNGTFRLKKKLSGGKSKKITITKTTKLSLYAVSKGTKVTAKQLKKKKLKKNSAYASYTYKITSGTPAGTGTFSSKASASPAVSDTAQTPSAADNTSASTAPGTTADPVKTSSPEQTADPDATAVPAGTADPTASADPAASSTPSAGTGSKLADSDYDFRYENCDTSSASVISTTTAGTTVQGGNSRP